MFENESRLEEISLHPENPFFFMKRDSRITQGLDCQVPIVRGLNKFNITSVAVVADAVVNALVNPVFSTVTQFHFKIHFHLF